MTSTLRSSLLRLGAVGCLFATIPACAGEVDESLPAGQQSAEAHSSAAESARLAEEDAAAESARLAVEADRVLAEQGDAGAQARLAQAHYLGLGAAHDYEEALRWARLAADRGDTLGQGVLAAAYNTGRGVDQDFEEALRWSRLAVDGGDAWGQAVLASLYREGRGGVDQDFEEAVRLYRLGAEQGYAGAQVNLGTMYMAGQGVEQDLVSAYMWMSLGASGPGVSSGGLEILPQFMTPEQIAEAEARARDWRR